MELWIRSQDKKILLKVETIEVINNWFYLNDKYDIGFYKTNERALKVLNEIHQRLIDLQALEIASNYYSTAERPLECVYEMPKE